MQIHLALLPILAQSDEANRWQQNEKRSALCQMLVHVQQVNQGRHENGTATDDQEAHQHTNAKFQQKNDEYHSDRTALCVSLRSFESSSSIFLPPALGGNLR